MSLKFSIGVIKDQKDLDDQLNKYYEALSQKININAKIKDIDNEGVTRSELKLAPVFTEVSSESKIKDSGYQRTLAYNILKDVFTVRDTDAILAKLIGDNDLTLFNQYHKKFFEELKPTKSTTPGFFDTSWKLFVSNIGTRPVGKTLEDIKGILEKPIKEAEAKSEAEAKRKLEAQLAPEKAPQLSYAGQAQAYKAELNLLPPRELFQLFNEEFGNKIDIETIDEYGNRIRESREDLVQQIPDNYYDLMENALVLKEFPKYKGVLGSAPIAPELPPPDSVKYPRDIAEEKNRNEALEYYSDLTKLDENKINDIINNEIRRRYDIAEMFDNKGKKIYINVDEIGNLTPDEKRQVLLLHRFPNFEINPKKERKVLKPKISKNPPKKEKVEMKMERDSKEEANVEYDTKLADNYFDRHLKNKNFDEILDEFNQIFKNVDFNKNIPQWSHTEKRRVNILKGNVSNYKQLIEAILLERFPKANLQHLNAETDIGDVNIIKKQNETARQIHDEIKDYINKNGANINRIDKDFDNYYGDLKESDLVPIWDFAKREKVEARLDKVINDPSLKLTAIILANYPNMNLEAYRGEFMILNQRANTVITKYINEYALNFNQIEKAFNHVFGAYDEKAQVPIWNFDEGRKAKAQKKNIIKPHLQLSAILLHQFPLANLEDWRVQFDHLRNAGYGLGKSKKSIGKGVEMKVSKNKEVEVPMYKVLGRYRINIPALQGGYLHLLYPSLNTIKHFKKQRIGNGLQDIIWDLVEDKKFNKKEYAKLSEKEKAVFDRLIDMIKIIPSEVAGMKDYIKSKNAVRDQNFDKLEILLGEVEAGNNSRQNLKDLNKLLLKMKADNHISASDYNKFQSKIAECL